MIIVSRNYAYNDEDLSGKYECVDDFVRDLVDKKVIEEWFTDCYGTVDVAGFKLDAGVIITKCLSKDYLRDIMEDFVDMESNYIEGELEHYGEFDYYGYLVKDPDFDLDEEED